MINKNHYLKNLKSDIPSGIVVFLVALPLCLGIALASGVTDNLFAGIITGIIGGVVVALLSGSHLAVSGPAAGLAVIVATAIGNLGYEVFLVAVVFSGLIQLGLGFAKAGFIARFFPNSVIKGMLAAIGIILILKQIPHALGDDLDYFGDMQFLQWDKKNTFSEIIEAFKEIHTGALIISSVSVAFLILWQTRFFKKVNSVPGPLIVVIGGVLLNSLFSVVAPQFAIKRSDHLVDIPIVSSFQSFLDWFTLPDFTALGNIDVLGGVLITSFTLAIIASLETLLSVEAIDKLDPQKRITPTNRELKAQGIGNAISGLIGGLPMTAVIVRGTANITSGAKTKMSAFFHGVFLLAAVLLIPQYINLIPYASLAAILFVVGYKLASFTLMKNMAKQGIEHSIPFFTTIVAIVLTDLLKGIMIGLAVAIFFILRRIIFNPYSYKGTGDANGEYSLVLAEEVSFLNKAGIMNALEKVPEGGHLVVDARHSKYIDDDVLEIIKDFKKTAEYKDIRMECIGFKSSYKILEKSPDTEMRAPEKVEG